MKRMKGIVSILGVTGLLLVGGVGCPKNKKESKDSTDAAKQADASTPKQEAPEVEEGLPDPDEVETLTLERVHFEFDQAKLTQQAKNVLKDNAQILKQNPAVKVRIEGHCDARGSTEYNLALGERRATAVRDYLADLGVSPDNLVTVSLGEEKPLEAGSSEGAWSRNRRAELVVVAGSDRVVGTAQ